MTYTPFALISDGLLFLPTPGAAHVKGYRDLFRRLHADAGFCETAFGDHFEPIVWSDEEMKDFFLNHDAKHRWGEKGMGDFALALLPPTITNNTTTSQDGTPSSQPYQGRVLSHSSPKIHIIQGQEYDSLSHHFPTLQWVGYTCVRDAAVDFAESGDEPRPWLEMVEMRYGLDPNFRGAGIATRSGAVVMQWAIEEHGARRFVAESMKLNVGSARVLERLGFERNSTNYFQDQATSLEWQKVVA